MSSRRKRSLLVAIATTLLVAATCRFYWKGRAEPSNEPQNPHIAVEDQTKAGADSLDSHHAILKVPPRTISYDTLIVTRANGEGLDDRLAILILQMAIPNSAKSPAILKDVRLLYNRVGIECAVMPSDVPVATDVGTRTNLNAILVRDGDLAHFLCGWKNLGEVIKQSETTLSGKSWKTSAAFIFPEPSLAFVEMSAFRLRFEDNLGNVSVHPLTIPEECVKLGPNQVYHFGLFTWNGD